MDEYHFQVGSTVTWETRMYRMSHTKVIGQFKADLNEKLRRTWNEKCETEGDMSDNNKIEEHRNLIAVIDWIEENQENAYTQITCRSTE